MVGDGVREEEAIGSARYLPPPDNGLGARADESLGGISRAGGACRVLVAEPDPLPDETLDAPARGRLLLLALELELGSDMPRGDAPANGDRAVGLEEGIES